MKNNSAFFQNTDCEYFPCHSTNSPDTFSCMFCFCPLYALGENCGGNFRYTDKGIKNCTPCLVPHKKENYEHIISKTKELVELVRRKTDE